LKSIFCVTVGTDEKPSSVPLPDTPLLDNPLQVIAIAGCSITRQSDHAVVKNVGEQFGWRGVALPLL
jgi:hypothetical protein